MAKAKTTKVENEVKEEVKAEVKETPKKTENKTVKMHRGSLMADICNKPECIAQAESEGYELVK